MHFYRRINPIHAISFDLDDTLYDNLPIIMQAEQAQLRYLQDHVAAAIDTDLQQWQQFRLTYAQQHPHLRHDIGKLRQTATEQQLLAMGVKPKLAKYHSQQAFQAFYQQRIKIVIDPNIINILTQLSSVFPLIAISNGNACLKAMGLSQIFQFGVFAGEQNRQSKPHGDLFAAASRRLSIAPRHLLHIGDSQSTDIKGALNAQWMTAWFNPQRNKLTTSSGLPHFEFEQISQLLTLI